MLNPYNYKYKLQRDFSQFLEDGAKECPDRIAVIHGEKRITYYEMNRRINKMANSLLQISDGKQLRIGIVSQNCIEYIELFLACARARMIVINMNWRCTSEELAYLIRQTDSGLIFYNPGDRHSMNEFPADIQESVRIINMKMDEMGVSEYEAFLEKGNDTPVVVDGHAEEVFSYFHTSGSSDIPKIVVFTHGELLSKLRALILGEGFEYGMVFQTMTQLFHAGSMGNYMCLACRGTLVIFNHFDAKNYLASMEQEQVERITVAPSTLRALLDVPDFADYDLSHLKYINYTMAPMPVTLINRALKMLPETKFMGIYGMTEMAGGVTALDHDDHFTDGGRLRLSVGCPMNGMRVRIEHEDGTLCPSDTIGEIVIQGCGMMTEYYRDAEATRQALRNGWFHSNDLGYLDKNGNLFLCGRRHNMIITGGENVFSTEVENILLEHDNVKEAAVFGIPDDTWGEMVCACVVCLNSSKFSQMELQQFCRQKIAGYKIPKAIFCVEKLPRNAVGKVLHRLLTDKYTHKK